MKELKYIKSKSARELLMTLGMNRNTLALDIRIQNIFKYLHIEFPDTKGLSIERIYTETENNIIEKICKPLHISPVTFDRLLFSHYKQILLAEFRRKRKNKKREMLMWK